MSEDRKTIREERGQIAGDLTVNEPLDLTGNVGGNLIIVKGGKVYVRGSVLGNMHVEQGGRVHLYGQIHGNITLAEDTKVILGGHVKGSVLNNGGRLFIEAKATVQGKVKSYAGETKYEVTPKMPEE